jgi:hypothetical protein
MFGKTYEYLRINSSKIIKIGREIDDRASFAVNREGLFFFLVEYRFKTDSCFYAGQKLYWAITTNGARKKAKRELIFEVINEGFPDD